MKKFNKMVTLFIVLFLGIFCTKNSFAKNSGTESENKIYNHIMYFDGETEDDKANSYYTNILYKLENNIDFNDWNAAKYFLDNSFSFYDNPYNETKLSLDTKYKNIYSIISVSHENTILPEEIIKNRAYDIIDSMPGNTHDEKVSSYYSNILDKKENGLPFNDLEAADYFLQYSNYFYFDANNSTKLALDARYQAYLHRPIKPVLNEMQIRVYSRINTMYGYDSDTRTNSYYQAILDKIEYNETFNDREAADYFLQNTDFFYTNPNNYDKLVLDTRYKNLRISQNTPSQSQGKFKDILIVRNTVDSNGQKEIVGYAQSVNGAYILNGNQIENTYSDITYDFSDNYKNIKGLVYSNEQTQPIIIVGYPKNIDQTINGYIRFWGSATNYYLALWNRTYVTGNNENGSQIFDLDAKNYFNQNLNKWNVKTFGRILGRMAYGYPAGVTGFVTGQILNQANSTSFGYDYYKEIEYQDSYNQHSHGYINLDQIRVHVVSTEDSREGEISATDLFNNKDRNSNLIEVKYVNSAGGKSTVWVDYSKISWFNR